MNTTLKSTAVPAVVTCALWLSWATQAGAGVREVHSGEPFAICRVEGIPTPARCGEIRVPEDPSRPEGRSIALNVVVIPGTASEGHPDPVVLLAGGPGQAATEQIPFAVQLATMLPGRDVVLVDQRGTGRSNPLVCGSGRWLEDARLGRMFLDGPGGAQRCLARLGSDADPRYYTTTLAVDDLEKVRDHLGYQTLNLIGISYGTRVADAYLERYPDRVRSLVLRAVAPAGFNIPVDGALAAQDALNDLIAACEADPACASAYPELGETIESLLSSAESSPEPILLTDPATGDTATVPLTRATVEAVLNVLLLGPTQRMLPYLVYQTTAQGAQVLAPVLAQVLPVYGSLPLGMYLAVTCTEDLPRASAAEVERLRSSFLTSFEALRTACSEWPVGVLPAGFHERSGSAVPVLLLSGEADPATRPEVAARALDYHSNAAHVVIPATSHGPPFPGCVESLVADFIAIPDPARVDAGCVATIQWSPFILPG